MVMKIIARNQTEGAGESIYDRSDNFAEFIIVGPDVIASATFGRLGAVKQLTKSRQCGRFVFGGESNVRTLGVLVTSLGTTLGGRRRNVFLLLRRWRNFGD
uniref:Uncharacterized protein n=1 Tax=Romanomermis culicivorax TaxID=13658 RepID=A0A915HZ74_ROMCU